MLGNLQATPVWFTPFNKWIVVCWSLWSPRVVKSGWTENIFLSYTWTRITGNLQKEVLSHQSWPCHSFSPSFLHNIAQTPLSEFKSQITQGKYRSLNFFLVPLSTHSHSESLNGQEGNPHKEKCFATISTQLEMKKNNQCLQLPLYMWSPSFFRALWVEYS